MRFLRSGTKVRLDVASVIPDAIHFVWCPDWCPMHNGASGKHSDFRSVEEVLKRVRLPYPASRATPADGRGFFVRRRLPQSVSQTMKVATYNIRKGGFPRVHWSTMIDDHGVDLLLVQESYSHDEHLPPHLYPDSRSQSVWE